MDDLDIDDMPWTYQMLKSHCTKVRVCVSPEEFELIYKNKSSVGQAGDLIVLNEHNGLLPTFFICNPDELYPVTDKVWT